MARLVGEIALIYARLAKGMFWSEVNTSGVASLYKKLITTHFRIMELSERQLCFFLPDSRKDQSPWLGLAGRRAESICYGADIRASPEC